MEERLRIGELAELTGVSVRSLRYYEDQGLLVAERSPSGQRHYAPDAVERVVLLKQLYAAGLTSRAISEVLPCVHAPSTQTNDDAFVRMLEQRERLSSNIEELQATLRSLDKILDANRRWRAVLAGDAVAADA
ncbi:MAG TPA: MerR family transcriptional regulator [Nocardioides sp.]|nr:MerR family transcriptional regulator [Nocardioides sp.]